jgi:hypothetical protein
MRVVDVTTGDTLYSAVPTDTRPASVASRIAAIRVATPSFA